MDIFANNRLIAKGEVIVVNEKFGVRLTDVVSTAERINKLK
jgi:flagellar motor switch protein FliN/FliY